MPTQTMKTGRITELMPGLGSRDGAYLRDLNAAELVLDHFAGGGGASLGIELALKRAVDQDDFEILGYPRQRGG